jgi:hypothetical protein
MFGQLSTPLVASAYCKKVSIFHMKRRAVFGLALAPVVKASGGNIGMAEPFLHLGNIRGGDTVIV